MPLALSHQHSPLDVVRLDLGRDKAVCTAGPSPGTGVLLVVVNHFSVANIKLTGLCKLRRTDRTLSPYNFGVFYNSRNYANPLFERSAIMPVPF